MDTLTLEEALRVITEKAAVMRFLSDSGSYADYQAPDSAVLRGLGAMCFGHRGTDPARQTSAHRPCA